MTYEQYWNDDPFLVRVYRRAHDLKRQEQNQILWLQGRYFFDGMNAVIGNFAAGLSGKRGDLKYVKEPYDIFTKTKTDKEIDAIKERNKIIDYFTQMKKGWDLTHQNGVKANGNS